MPCRRTLVPSCRMMMPPAFTGWPPYTLTPRRLDCESRPFLVLPAPFLCAASMVRGVATCGSGRRGRMHDRQAPAPAGRRRLRLGAHSTPLAAAASRRQARQPAARGAHWDAAQLFVGPPWAPRAAHKRCAPRTCRAEARCCSCWPARKPLLLSLLPVKVLASMAAAIDDWGPVGGWGWCCGWLSGPQRRPESPGVAKQLPGPAGGG